MTIRRILLYASAAAALAAAACACKEKERELPPTDGKFERYTKDMTMHSDILNTDIKFSVYLPASYVTDKDRRYSVVYMLHGLGDNCNSWNGNYIKANTRINALEGKGQLSDMIYVYPSGFSSYYCNYYTGKYNYMDMFTQEFVPYIDSNFRTIADRGHRGLVGYSMGGFGAMVMAERNPDMFCCSAPLSMSFRTDKQYMAEPQGGWDGQWGKIFGGIGQAGYDRLTDYYKLHCPFYQFVPENKSKLSQVEWFFICGDDEEQLLIANDTLHVQLRDNGFRHEFRVVDGGHSADVWNAALNEALPMFDKVMNGGSAWPECSNPTYTKKDVKFSEDGTAPSAAYTAEEGGIGVYFAHDALTREQIRDIMSVFYSTNTKSKFIFLPCDISQKSLHGWMSYYKEKYTQTGCYGVGIGKAGATILAEDASFNTLVFVDAELGEAIFANPQKNYIFACTDDSENYKDMGALYRSCKKNGAKFEYRVVNTTGENDLLKCAEKIKTYITY